MVQINVSSPTTYTRIHPHTHTCIEAQINITHTPQRTDIAKKKNQKKSEENGQWMDNEMHLVCHNNLPVMLFLLPLITFFLAQRSRIFLLLTEPSYYFMRNLVAVAVGVERRTICYLRFFVCWFCCCDVYTLFASAVSDTWAITMHSKQSVAT